MITDMATRDWKTELCAKIALMRERELPELVDRGIRDLFAKIGERKSREIIRRLQEQPKIPQNISGMIEKEIATIEAEAEKNSWKKTVEGAGSSEEFRAMMEFLSELTEWHRQGLVATDPLGSTTPMSIDEWAAFGRPKTWSPIVDHWLAGFEKAYKTDVSMPGYLLHYLLRYNQILRTKRLTRHGGMHDKDQGPDQKTQTEIPYLLEFEDEPVSGKDT
jgi:hypothetical protein